MQFPWSMDLCERETLGDAKVKITVSIPIVALCTGQCIFTFSEALGSGKIAL